MKNLFKPLLIGGMLTTCLFYFSVGFAGTARCYDSAGCTFTNLDKKIPSAEFWIEIVGNVRKVVLKNEDVKIRGFHDSTLTFSGPDAIKKLANSYFDAIRGGGFSIAPKVFATEVRGGDVIFHHGTGGKQRWPENYYGGEAPGTDEEK